MDLILFFAQIGIMLSIALVFGQRKIKSIKKSIKGQIFVIDKYNIICP